MTGVCEAYQDQYSCTVPNETMTQATNCPANVFCLGTSCFDTAYTNDADFARTAAMVAAVVRSQASVNGASGHSAT